MTEALQFTGITDEHPDYTANLPDWQQCRRCVEGQRAIKAETTEYLPPQGACMTDDNGAVNSFYTAYISRALFVNYSGRTVDSLVGLAFKTDPEANWDAMANVAYLEENIDGDGNRAAFQFKKALRDIVTVGRGGLLVDFPILPEGATVADEAGAAAMIKYYTAEDVINWEFEVVAGRRTLSLLVLREEDTNNPESTEATGTKYQYRRLWIDADGFLAVAVCDDAGVIKDDLLLPTMNNGRLTKIPFEFISATGEAWEICKPPILAITDVNVKHYQVTAEKYQCMNYGSQPTGVVSGATQTFIDKHKNGLELGAGVVLLLEAGGDFKLVVLDYKAAGYNEDLTTLRDSIVELGGQMVLPTTGGVESAEAVRLKRSGDLSVMGSIILAVSDAYEKAIAFAGEWMGSTVTPEIEFNSEFITPEPDAQVLAQLINSLTYQVIGKLDVREYMRITGIIPPERTDEQIDADIEDEAPAGGAGVPVVETPPTEPVAVE